MSNSNDKSESEFLLIKRKEFNILLKNMQIIREYFKDNPLLKANNYKMETQSKQSLVYDKDLASQNISQDYNDMIYRSRIFILETVISMIIDIKNHKIKQNIMITSQFLDIIDDNKKKELTNPQETELSDIISNLLSISIKLRKLYGSGDKLNNQQQKFVSHIYMIKTVIEESYLLKNKLIIDLINFN